VNIYSWISVCLAVSLSSWSWTSWNICWVLI